MLSPEQEPWLKLLSNVSKVGVHVFGHVDGQDNLQRLLETFSLCTHSSFGTRQSGKVTEVTDNEPADVPVRRKVILWQQKQGHIPIPYSGTPFVRIPARSTVLECQHGPARSHSCKQPDQGESSKKTSKRKYTQLQGTKKGTCFAQIHIAHVKAYPDFAIKQDTTQLTAAWQIRKDKENAVTSLLTHLQSSKLSSSVAVIDRFYVSLPMPEAHNGHLDSIFARAVAGRSQRVHPQLVEKIHELSAAGIRDASDIKRLLTLEVEEKYQFGTVKPSTTDRAYYPLLKDIRWHQFSAARQLSLSQLDQVQLQAAIEGWKSTNKDANFFFRPYSAVDASEDNAAGDASRNTLLFVHQEAWQRDLLQKYGHFAMIDATYRTTQYDVPLFLLVVPTNVGFTVAAEFCLQSETSQDIAEALNVLKKWNPTWSPRYFMSDYAEAEMLAIRKVFPNSKSFLCDFHREQSWLRWVRDRKHGLNTDEGDLLMSLLRKMVFAKACEVDGKPIDFYFKEAEDQLKRSSVWSRFPQVRAWLESKWLSIPEQWAHCFRSGEFMMDIHTNNAVEAQNKWLKYSFLPRGKKTTLTGVLKIIINEYLPANLQSYVDRNIFESSLYAKYTEAIPDFLKNRPRKVILHCLARHTRSLKYEEGSVQQVNNEGSFKVLGSSADWKIVNFQQPSCSCKDWKTHKIPCKHFFAVFHHFPSWDWGKLPSKYISQPRLSIDTMLVECIVSGQQVQPATMDRPDMDLPNHANNHHSQMDFESIPNHQTPAQSLLVEAARARAVLKSIESQSYICKSLEGLQLLTKDLKEAQSRFDKRLPKDSQGLIVPDQHLVSRLYGRQKALRKLIAARQVVAKSRKNLPLYKKRGRAKLKSKLRHTVGMRAERNHDKTKAVSEDQGLSTLTTGSKLHRAHRKRKAMHNDTDDQGVAAKRTAPNSKCKVSTGTSSSPQADIHANHTAHKHGLHLWPPGPLKDLAMKSLQQPTDESALLQNIDYVNKVILAQPSSAHGQLSINNNSSVAGQSSIFQQQGSSNLCGVCCLNNALGHVQFQPADLDGIADTLWTETIVASGSFSTHLPELRYRDGMYSFEVLQAAAQVHAFTLTRFKPQTGSLEEVKRAMVDLHAAPPKAMVFSIIVCNTGHYTALVAYGSGRLVLLDSLKKHAVSLQPADLQKHLLGKDAVFFLHYSKEESSWTSFKEDLPHPPYADNPSTLDEACLNSGTSLKDEHVLKTSQWKSQTKAMATMSIPWPSLDSSAQRLDWCCVSKDILDHVATVFQHRNPNTVIGQTANEGPIYVADLHKLKPGELINDKIVNSFLNMVVKHINKVHGDEHFAKALTSLVWLELERNNALARLERWFQNDNLLQFKRVVLPVCHQSHWVVFVADVETQTCNYFNSLGCTRADTFIIDGVRTFLNKFAKSASNKCLGQWTIFPSQTGMQRNSSDCGVFIIIWAMYTLMGKGIDFFQDDMAAMRLWMAAKLLLVLGEDS